MLVQMKTVCVNSMLLHVIFLWLVFNAPSTIAVGNITTKERDLLNRLLNPDVYDATIRPRGDSGERTRVELDLAVTSLGPLNDFNMEFSASFFLRQSWRDHRLAYDDLNSSIVISEKRLDSLWVPDLYFPQSKRESRHDITIPNIMIRLSPDGSILYSQRLSVTFDCHMDLYKFPLDKQTCQIDMESYSFTSDDLYFAFSSEREPVQRGKGVSIPDFTITGITHEDCSVTYATGTFTCLRAILHLKREIGFYATQTYVPSILIVALSWASFWIDHEAVPARISVGLLTVLTITSQSSGARAQLPRVPYVKGIDVWMTSCLVFVFAAYMEYAFVTVLSRRYKKGEKYNSKVSNNTSFETDPSKPSTFDDSKSTSSGSNGALKQPKDAGKKMDTISRYGFPLSFLIFNIGYWVYYIYVV